MSSSNGNGRAHVNLSGGFLATERDLEFKPVSIAVVGLGYWGPNLARNLQECPYARLAALCDLSRERLERIGRRYPAARCYNRSRRCSTIRKSKRSRSRPPFRPIIGSHPRRSDAGKHVFVEKPLAASSRGGARAGRARRARRAGADAGAHVPLQPAGDMHRD